MVYIVMTQLIRSRCSKFIITLFGCAFLIKKAFPNQESLSFLIRKVKNKTLIPLKQNKKIYALKSTFLIRKAFLNQESTTKRRHYEFRTSTTDKLGHYNVDHTLKAAKFQIAIAHYSVYTSKQNFQDILPVVQCPIQQRKECAKMSAVGEISHLS